MLVQSEFFCNNENKKIYWYQILNYIIKFIKKVLKLLTYKRKIWYYIINLQKVILTDKKEIIRVVKIEKIKNFKINKIVELIEK